MLHGIKDKLEHESVAVFRNKGLASLARPVEITFWDDAALIRLWGEKIRSKAVFLDDLLLNYPKYFGPDFADSMNTPIAGFVQGFVRRGVDGEVLERGY